MDAWYPEAIEPVLWNVVFHRKARSRWTSAVAMGHFKHVSAFAYLGGLRGWIMFDVQFARLRIVVMPDNAASQRTIWEVMDGNAVIEMRRSEGGGVRFFRAGFFCTIAIKHLLGLRSRALRPDRFYRDCLRAGGYLVPPTPAG